MSRDAERRARLDAVMRGSDPPSATGTKPAGTKPPGTKPADPGPAGPRPAMSGSAGKRRRTPTATGTAARAAGLPAVADRRGLTATGIVLVNLVGGFAGATYDLSHGTHILGTVTAITFVIGALAGVLTAHREDLGAAVVVPPLAYAAVVFVAANVTGSGGSGSYLHNVAAETVVHVLTSAPGLLIAVAGTAVIAIVRFLGGRAATNRRRAAARIR